MMKRFGEKLRTLRKRRGMSQEEVGHHLGVSRPYIGKMEHGEKIPNVIMAIKISRLFGVTVDQLVKDELDID